MPGHRRERRQASLGATGPGNHWLRTALVEVAHAAARTKGTHLAAQYKRIAARRGTGRAAVAVAHSILVIIYHLLRDGVIYQDLGATWFDQRDRSATVRRTVRRLEALGYRVTVQEAA